jgi:hypothetical protein
MPDPKQKLVKVGDDIVAFPGDMEDDHISNAIKSFRAKKNPSLTTEESEHSRQLKPAKPLDTAIPHLPEWANTPLEPKVKAGVDTVTRALWPAGTANYDKLTAQAQADKQRFMGKHPIAGGVFEGVNETAEGLTSPSNLALMIAAPESKIMSGLFAIQALHGSYKDIEEARKAYREGRNAEASKYATQAVLNLGIAGLAGHHAVKDIPVPEGVKDFVKSEEGFVDPIKQWPQFKQWFGNSKVVDEAGKPKVVYHGTQKDFEAFDPKAPHQSPNTDDSVLFFTNHPAIAETYSGKNETGSNIIPAYLSLKNPMVIDGLDRRTNTPFPLFKVVREDAIKHAREKGYDGIIVKNTADRGGYGYPDTGPTDVYIVFNPENVKSAIGNSGAFDPKSGSLTDPRAPKLSDVKAKAAELQPTTAYKATDDTQPFYLKSENLINEKMKGPMPAADLQKMLLSNGVKEEEMKWTGLDEFLQGKGNGKVTPQEIQEHLAGNNLQIQEVAKGEKHIFPPKEVQDAAIERFDKAKQALTSDHTRSITGTPEYDRIAQEYKDAESAMRSTVPGWEIAESGETTKHSHWQLPGAEPGSYRELIITMPGLGRDPVYQKLTDNYSAAEKASYDYMESHKQNLSAPDEEMKKVFANTKAAKDALDQYKAKKDKESPGGVFRPYENDFSTPHWDEKNHIGHVRFNDRKGPNGEKLLHIEEIQSDLHELGRKKGYQEPVEKMKLVAKEIQPGWYEVSTAEGRFVTNVTGGAITPAQAIEFAEQRLREEPRRTSKGQQAPNAPWEKTWQEQLFKRMVKYAADHGYDGVSWTPGEAQAERYDLSKQVKEMFYYPDTQRLIAYGLDGQRIINDVIPPDKLPDTIGKEAAQKLLDAPPLVNRSAAETADKIKDLETRRSRLPLQTTPESLETLRKINAEIDRLTKKKGMETEHYLGGVDLKVGGKGMKGFYDKIIPDAANKLGKPWGAKVGETKINVSPQVGPDVSIVDDHGLFQVNDPNEPHEQPLAEFDTLEEAKNYVKALGGGKKTVPYLPITPQMRAGVKGVPYSLFGIPLAAGALSLAQVKEKADKLKKGGAQ